MAEATSLPPGPLAQAVEPLLRQAGLLPPISFHALLGGANNRVYRVQAASGQAVLKCYFRHPGDQRDRLAAEYSFSRFAWEQGLRQLPWPLGCLAPEFALYEFVDGRKLEPAEVSAAHVDQALGFFRAINAARHTMGAAQLAAASEACFSLAEHLACIERRVDLLGMITDESPQHCAAAALARERIAPAWARTSAAVERLARRANLEFTAPLPLGERCLSPSDFGFHNALLRSDGRLCFFDFEYAGWDDPAKLACDFFCQVELPPPPDCWNNFLRSIAADLGDPRLVQRSELLLPAYRIKWCCIVLNAFLPIGSARQQFSGTAANQARGAETQLQKATWLLARVEDDLARAEATLHHS